MFKRPSYNKVNFMMMAVWESSLRPTPVNYNENTGQTLSQRRPIRDIFFFDEDKILFECRCLLVLHNTE